jgi:L-threonylcarbamoyladenylate synthase
MNRPEIRLAAQALKAGHLVAFATETVYGLGADASNAAVVARIYETKGRPADHPLIVHVSDAKQLEVWAREVPEYASELAADFWPGAMTLVLKRSQVAKDFITGGQDTVGVRVPGHVVALELLREFEQLGGLGVAAPSANRFGKVSPTTAQAVGEELGRYLAEQDLILEGGASEVGIESTIIDCTTERPRILRLGAITEQMIEQSTGLQVSNEQSQIRVSGSLESHYSPNAKLFLDIQALPGDGFIALSTHETPEGAIRLCAPETTEEYAQQLYAALRRADEFNLSRIVAITPTGDELSLAIADRLLRASR